jgi:hypothetical protein
LLCSKRSPRYIMCVCVCIPLCTCVLYTRVDCCCRSLHPYPSVYHACLTQNGVRFGMQ